MSLLLVQHECKISHIFQRFQCPFLYLFSIISVYLNLILIQGFSQKRRWVQWLVFQMCRKSDWSSVIVPWIPLKVAFIFDFINKEIHNWFEFSDNHSRIGFSLACFFFNGFRSLTTFYFISPPPPNTPFLFHLSLLPSFLLYLFWLCKYFNGCGFWCLYIFSSYLLCDLKQYLKKKTKN